MPFDCKEFVGKMFPTPKPGQWVPCEYGLPKEFELVVFAVDDGSTEGMLYMGYREESMFRMLYGETDGTAFQIGGRGGVLFWTLVPDNKNLFAATLLQ